MSGGSFNYLCWREDSELNDDLARMADELDELGFPEAATATRSLIFQPSEDLRRVWRAVEWWRSNDSSREAAIETAKAFKATKEA